MEKLKQNLIRVDFKTPLPYGKETLDGLDIRTPLAGDLRGLKLGELYSLNVDDVLKLVPRISQQAVTSEQLAKLPLTDLNLLSKTLMDFFTGGETTE